MKKPLEYTFEVQCKTDVSTWGLWHWQIRRTSTGEIVESSKDGLTHRHPFDTAPPASPVGERAGFAAKPNSARSRSLFSVSMNRTDS